MTKIILIEDDPTMRMLLKTLLEIEGFEVNEWNMGAAPVESIRKSNPDYVLMDVNLKGGHNGFDILAQIRADDELKHLKVIMSSGMDYRQKCQAQGADFFIMKPYMPDDLIQMIRTDESAGV